MRFYNGDPKGGIAGWDESKHAYADAMLLKNMAQKTVFEKYATIRKELPQNVGNYIEFNRKIPMLDVMFANNLNKQFVSGYQEGMDIYVQMPRNAWEDFVLPEGSSGDEKGDWKYQTINAEAIPIGQWRSHTEEMKLFSQKWRIDEEMMEQSDVASQVIDGYYRDTMSLGCTNVGDISGNSGNDALVSSSKFTEAVEKAVMGLRLSGANPVNYIVSSSPNYATRPVQAFYRMLIPTVAVTELRKNPDFVKAEDAGISKHEGFNAWENHEGFIGGVSVYSTPNQYFEVNGSNYKGEFMIYGQDHTAHIPVRGKNRIEFVIKALGQDGSDKLNRVGSVGWKSWLSAKVLYPERIAKVVAKFKA